MTTAERLYAEFLKAPKRSGQRWKSERYLDFVKTFDELEDYDADDFGGFLLDRIERLECEKALHLERRQKAQ